MAKPKLIHVRIENTCSWYGSRFIWTSTGTDGSQNYLEHIDLSKKHMAAGWVGEWGVGGIVHIV